MKPTEKEIAEAMKTIREACVSAKCCAGCALFNETNQRCVLRTDSPTEWKINEPPAEIWRVVR
jgi:hypothetical protein